MFDPKDQHPSELVKRGVFETNMYFVTVYVDGEMARDLLGYNREPKAGESSTNRKASKVLVEDYAALMVKDKWYLSPQPIIFSDKDEADMTPLEIEELIDGQQRLKAVVLASGVRADIMVPFTLCFDAPSKAKWLLDMGKKRQPGDFLRMGGEVNAGNLARALRLLYAVTKLRPFKSINLWRHLKLSPEEQWEFLEEHSSLRQGLEIAQQMKTLVMPHVGATLFYLVAREFGAFKAQELFNGLVSGANLSPADPRLKVREFIAARNTPARGSKHRWDGFQQLALLITASNAWLIGDEDYKPNVTFNKLSTVFPELFTKEDMPTTFIVPGNDPNIG